jgi:hypothetical protein
MLFLRNRCDNDSMEMMAKRPKRPEPEIPHADLKPGIQRCFAKGRSLLESSMELVAVEKPDAATKSDAAANLFVLALQEIGKAKLLREAYETGHLRPKIVGFYNHEVKTEKGISVLGSSTRWLKRGAFNAKAFSNAFAVGVPADEPTRLELLYVNYNSDRWLDPPPLDVLEVRARIEETLARLSAVEDSMLK